MFVHALEEVSLQFQHHKPQLRPLVHLPPTRANNKETKRPKQTHQVPNFNISSRAPTVAVEFVEDKWQDQYHKPLLAKLGQSPPTREDK